MAELTLIREDNNTFHFAYPSKQGIFPLALGAGTCFYGALAVSRNLILDIILCIIGGLFVVISVMIFSWRHRLQINLAQRLYIREAGTWPFVKTASGPLTNIQGVVLTLTEVTQGKCDVIPYWLISLSFADYDRLVSIDESCDENEAREKLRMWSTKLHTQPIDRTSEGVIYG